MKFALAQYDDHVATDNGTKTFTFFGTINHSHPEDDESSSKVSYSGVDKQERRLNRSGQDKKLVRGATTTTAASKLKR